MIKSISFIVLTQFFHFIFQLKIKATRLLIYLFKLNQQYFFFFLQCACQHNFISVNRLGYNWTNSSVNDSNLSKIWFMAHHGHDGFWQIV